ncbi:MAG: (Fe-S)-binding protein [Gemmatimonadota bacterium]
MTSVALFVPCYIDQFYPHVAIAALQVLERLGIAVTIPAGAVCCGQPPANAGFERSTDATLKQFVDEFAPFEQVVVLSGSCALHVRLHAAHTGGAGAAVAARTTEFCAFLHDVVGVDRIAALDSPFTGRVGVHIGCHSLRGMGLAKPTELQVPPFNKVRSLLETVPGVSFAELRRSDECCGFGGTFAMTEQAISVRMGEDRLRDYRDSDAEAIVSSDMSCVMHLQGLAQRNGVQLPMLHVAEVLNGGRQRT